MRPYPEEVTRAIQNVMLQHFAPELTTPFSQREMGIVALMFSVAGRGRDTEVPDLIEENRALRELLAESAAALAPINRDDAKAAREAIAALPRTETSLKLSDLRRENDALRGTLSSLAPLIEPAADDALLAPLRDVRVKVYAHLKADAQRRQVPMLGEPAASHAYNGGMIELIRSRLASFQPTYVDNNVLPRAAVLLPIYDSNDEPHVLFTVRSELVEHHKGQISFPGGAADAGDPDLAHTARRETFEEIGVAMDHVEIIGQLDEMITVSNFLVRPFVGRITEPGPYPFAHSEIEVAEILEVPLSHLRDGANVVADLREYQGREVMMYSYVFGKHVIWGATARMLKQFLDLLGVKVLFLLHQGNMFSGGQGVYTAQVTRELAALGHEVHLIVGPPWPDTDPAVTVHRVPSYSVYRLLETQRMWFYGREPRSFFNLLNAYELATSRAGMFSVMSAFSWRAYMRWRDLQPLHRFDIVHDVQSLGYGDLMMKAAGMPVVANIHHPLSIDRMNQVLQAGTVGLRLRKIVFYPFFMQELVARRVDRIITGSHKSRASVQQAFRLRDEQITAIHDGVDTRVFRPRELPRRPNGLLYVGNSDDRNKGASYLLEAAAMLRDRGVEFHLDFVDRPGAEAAPRMVGELGLDERVTFVNQERAARGLGRLSEEELARTYNEAQVMVSPSLYEGFGLPAAEAQACGTPVVATTAGAFPEVVADGETGLLVPPGDARALANAIQSLLSDPPRRAAMGAAGARRIEEQFSWRVCAMKTAELYRQVLASAPIHRRRGS